MKGMIFVATASTLREYLVALGMKDNVSAPLQRTLRQNSQRVRSFTRSFALAGTAMAGMLVAGGVGLARFANNLVKTDERVRGFADEMGKSHEEAMRLKFTLDAMGKSMEEIEASPELMRTFQRLQKDAAKIAIPDMSEGLEQVRGIQTEFARFRQIGAHAIQWIGHHLLKYIAQPMEALRSTFSDVNDGVLRNLPEWSKRIAGVMASVVRIVAATIRGATAIFRAIQGIFQMIPKEIQILTGIFAGFMMYLRAGPVGRLMMIFSLLMLLVEDFFTYLDGGEALLGGFWGWLLRIFGVLNESGGVIDSLREGFIIAMEAIRGVIQRAIGWIGNLWEQLRNSDALDNFRNAFQRVGNAVSAIFRAIRDIINTVFGAFFDGAEGMTPFFVWLIGSALPAVIGLIADVAGAVAGAVSWFMNLRFAREILMGIAIAIGAVVVAMTAYKIAIALTTAYMKAMTGVKKGLIAIIKAATAVKWLFNAALWANPITWIVAAIIALIAIIVLLVKNWEAVADFFRNLWERIKAIFRAAWDFIRNIIGAVVDFIRRIWDGIVGFFRGIWNAVTGIFRAVGDWFRERFQAAVDGIRNVFSAIIGFFTGIWDSITGIFSGIGEWFGNIFSRAADGIRNAFSGIRDFFSNMFQAIGNIVKAPINAIIRGINFFINGLNRIQIPNWVPGIGGRGINIPNVPELRRGGVLKKGQTGYLEGDGAEAVVPLEKNTEWIGRVATMFKEQVASAKTGMMDGGYLKDIAAGISKGVELLSKVASALNVLDKGLNQGVATNQSSQVINNYNTYDLKSNYNIKDSSGNPKTVAREVDRTKNTQLRNLKGVLNT